MPVYRDLWEHIGKEMPKKGAGKSGELDPLRSARRAADRALRALQPLRGRVRALAARRHRRAAGVHRRLQQHRDLEAGLRMDRRLGARRARTASAQTVHAGPPRAVPQLRRARQPPAAPEHAADRQRASSNPARRSTTSFREARRRRRSSSSSARWPQREGAGSCRGEITDSDLLREVMNTVGQPGPARRADPLRRLGVDADRRLGHQHRHPHPRRPRLRHPAPVRAGGRPRPAPAVLRAQRRRACSTSNMPTSWASRSTSPPSRVKVKPKPPKPVTRVHAVKEREALEIRFPRVAGYRLDLPDERLDAHVHRRIPGWSSTPELVGPCTVRLEGHRRRGRRHLARQCSTTCGPSTIAFHLAKHLLDTHFRDDDEPPPHHLFGQLQRIARRWIDEGYLVTARAAPDRRCSPMPRSPTRRRS